MKSVRIDLNEKCGMQETRLCDVFTELIVKY